MPLLCTYCNSLANTKDHVPPKLIFPKPRPRLITVPACSICNHQASKDDEYFRLVSVLEEKSGEHTSAVGIQGSVLRSLERSEAKGLKTSFQQQINYFDIVTEAGIYLGTSLGYEVDRSRLNRVIQRVTRGIFLHTFGRRLPIEAKVSATPARILKDQSAVDFVNNMLTHGPPWQCLGESTFCWKYITCAEQQDTSAWLFIVYHSIAFLSFTIGEKPQAPEQKHGQT